MFTLNPDNIRKKPQNTKNGMKSVTNVIQLQPSPDHMAPESHGNNQQQSNNVGSSYEESNILPRISLNSGTPKSLPKNPSKPPTGSVKLIEKKYNKEQKGILS